MIHASAESNYTVYDMFIVYFTYIASRFSITINIVNADRM
jgi:hypothetical protein